MRPARLRRGRPERPPRLADRHRAACEVNVPSHTQRQYLAEPQLSGWWLVVYWTIIAVLAATLIFMLGLIAYGIVTG